MFLYKGKEYYPLGIMGIMGKDGKEIYDVSKRNKSYVYIAVTEKDEKEINK